MLPRLLSRRHESCQSRSSRAPNSQHSSTAPRSNNNQYTRLSSLLLAPGPVSTTSLLSCDNSPSSILNLPRDCVCTWPSWAIQRFKPFRDRQPLRALDARQLHDRPNQETASPNAGVLAARLVSNAQPTSEAKAPFLFQTKQAVRQPGRLGNRCVYVLSRPPDPAVPETKTARSLSPTPTRRSIHGNQADVGSLRPSATPGAELSGAKY